MGNLTQAQAQELFTYDPETGWLQWKVRGKGRSLKRAGSLLPIGYRYINIGGKPTLEHRIIWLLVHGKLPFQIDHINRIRDDNRLVNLREATKAQNSINHVKQRKSKTGFRGVTLRTGKNYTKPYRAAIKVHYRMIWLGDFCTAEEAGAVVLQARQRIFGEFIDPALWIYK